MTTGDRIKDRRVALGLSVDELAEKLGKNRATVYRYESNHIENMPAAVLTPLANALETTPAHLMGYDAPVDRISSGGNTALSPADYADIARDMARMVDALHSGDSLMFDGDPLGEEAKASILAAMQLGLEAAKAKNKQRFGKKKNKGD